MIVACFGAILFLLAVIAGVIAMFGMMNDSNNRYPGWLLLIALVLGLLGYSMLPAAAHDHGRPSLDDWYPTLRSPAGAPCCDGPSVDAVHLADVDWESRDGRYRVRIDGECAAWCSARWPQPRRADAGLADMVGRQAGGAVLHAGSDDVDVRRKGPIRNAGLRSS